MDDLTVLYVTANAMPERWMQFQLHHLKEAIGDTQVISLSRKPMPYLGTNILDTEPQRYWNIYHQMMVGALRATTPFVAMVEDDTLYTKAHFKEFRPPKDKVSFNRARWSLFTWDNIYCVRQRVSNCSFIAPRELVIEAVQERERKYPEGLPDEMVGEIGREKIERRMGVSIHGAVEWYCSDPIVQLNHPSGTDQRQKEQWKRHGQIKAYDIPRWGKAVDVIKIYKDALAAES